MKSIIRQIYDGECGNYETIKASEEYWKVHEDYGKIYNELERGLTKEQNEILQNLYVTSGGLEAEMGFTHFKEGFRLGMLIAEEVFHR